MTTDENEKIEKLLYPLIGETKKSMPTLKRELAEIIKYEPKVKNAEESQKIVLARSVLRERYKKEPKVVETPPEPMEPIEIPLKVVLTEEHIKKLKSPMLMLDVIDEVQKQGIIGNEPVILGITTVSSLRFVKNKEATSSNLLLSSITGTAKDRIVKLVLNVIAEKNKTFFHRTGLSDKVFRYWSQPSSDIDSWDDVIMYLEDPEPDLLNGQTFKVVASGGGETSTVKDQEVLHIKFEGKPTFIVTSMLSTLNVEGSRRWLGIPTDSSTIVNVKVQQDKIKRHNNPYIPDKILNEALCYGLKKYNVVIPKIEVLTGFLDPTILNNTSIDALIDYIKAITVLHQYQRETDENGNLVATDNDIFTGAYVFTMIHQKGGISSFLEENIYSVLLTSNRHMFKREIEDKYNKMFDTGLSSYKIKKTLNIMIEKGRITSTHAFDEDSNRPIPAYSLKKTGEKNSEINLFTKEQEGSKNAEKFLITKEQIGDKRNSRDVEKYKASNKLNITNIDFFLSILTRRVENKINITRSLISLNRLITNLLHIFLVNKFEKNQFLFLITKNAEIVEKEQEKENFKHKDEPAKPEDVMPMEGEGDDFGVI